MTPIPPFTIFFLPWEIFLVLQQARRNKLGPSIPVLICPGSQTPTPIRHFRPAPLLIIATTTAPATWAAAPGLGVGAMQPFDLIAARLMNQPTDGPVGLRYSGPIVHALSKSRLRMVARSNALDLSGAVFLYVIEHMPLLMHIPMHIVKENKQRKGFIPAFR